MSPTTKLATPAYSGSETPASRALNKYIVFELAGYFFALPSKSILRVVTTPSPSEGGMVSMGLVQLEQYSIQILNLAELLFLEEKTPSEGNAIAGQLPMSDPGAAQNPPFLIVLQNADKQLWGIAVDEPPDLMDVPNYALRPVPADRRLARTLRWVSHIVTYDLEGDRHTLLVLALSVLLVPEQLQADPASDPVLEPADSLETDNTRARQSEMYA